MFTDLSYSRRREAGAWIKLDPIEYWADLYSIRFVYVLRNESEAMVSPSRLMRSERASVSEIAPQPEAGLTKLVRFGGFGHNDPVIVWWVSDARRSCPTELVRIGVMSEVRNTGLIGNMRPVLSTSGYGRACARYKVDIVEVY